MHPQSEDGGKWASTEHENDLGMARKLGFIVLLAAVFMPLDVLVFLVVVGVVGFVCILGVRRFLDAL